MMWKIALVIPVLLFVESCNSRRSPVVAEVNGKKITADEFAERYAKYRSSAPERDNIVTRKKILTNMVNEHLIFDDVQRQHLDSDSLYREKLQDIQDQALLDGYAKHLTVDTLTVNESELWSEFRAFNTRVAARYVYAKSEAEAWQLRKRLLDGVSFAQLAKQTFSDPTLANNGGYLGMFGYGDTEESLQDVAFTLPLGELSKPVKIRVGYAIVKVEKHIERPLASESDYAKQKPKLEESIRERKIMQLLKSDGDQIAEQLSPAFNDEALGKVLEQWSLIAGDSTRARTQESGQALHESLETLPLVRFKGFSWSVGDFTQRLGKTSAKYLRRVRTVTELKQVIEGFAIRVVLLQKARDLGLDREERVVGQIERARQDFLLRRWASSVQDTVSSAAIDEKTLRGYFEQNSGQFADPPLVDAAEILVKSETEAKQLLAQVRQGVDFGMLARRHSIRTSAVRQNGELGFVSQSAFGAVGPKVFRAKVGEVIGPESLNPNFVLLKILAKKPGRQRTYEQSRENVVQALMPEAKTAAFAGAVERLRANSVIRMNIEALGNVEVASN